MKKLFLLVAAALLSSSAGATDTFAGATYHNVIDNSGTTVHVGGLRTYTQDKTGGAVDSKVCIATSNDSVFANQFCVDKDGNVTATGTFTWDDAAFVRVDGTHALTDNWNAGAYTITASTFAGDLTGNADTCTALTDDSDYVRVDGTHALGGNWALGDYNLTGADTITGTTALNLASASNGELEIAPNGSGDLDVRCDADTLCGFGDGTYSSGHSASYLVETIAEFDEAAYFDSTVTVAGGINLAATKSLCLDGSDCHERIVQLADGRVFLYSGETMTYYTDNGNIYFTGIVFYVLENTYLGSSVAEDTLHVSSTAIHYGPLTAHQGVTLGSGLGATVCIDANTTGTDPTNGICWGGAGAAWVFDNNIDATGKTITAATFSGDLTGDVTGNADTASALAANPSDCAGGEYATGIAADGDLTCAAVVADVPDPIEPADGTQNITGALETSTTIKATTDLTALGNVTFGNSIAADTCTTSCTATHYGTAEFVAGLTASAAITSESYIETTGANGNLKLCAQANCLPGYADPYPVIKTTAGNMYFVANDTYIGYWGAGYLGTLSPFLAYSDVQLGNETTDALSIHAATINWGAGGDSDFCIDVNTADADSDGLCWDHDGAAGWRTADTVTITGPLVVDDAFGITLTGPLTLSGNISHSNGAVVINDGDGLSMSDYSITNVADIDVDSITPDASDISITASLGTITMSGAALDLDGTGVLGIKLDSASGNVVIQGNISCSSSVCALQNIQLLDSSADKVLCRKSTGVIGYCTDINTSTGACTCN